MLWFDMGASNPASENLTHRQHVIICQPNVHYILSPPHFETGDFFYIAQAGLKLDIYLRFPLKPESSYPQFHNARRTGLYHHTTLASLLIEWCRFLIICQRPTPNMTKFEVPWDRRGGSVVEYACCSRRGTEFNSQHLHWASHNCL